MANPEHVAKLKEGREAWNAWRKTSGDIPDLSGVHLDGDCSIATTYGPPISQMRNYSV
jgi:hypothetical protein